MAFQTAAKATRDALFLTNWDVTALPTMVIAASVSSLALAYGFSWLMPIVGPTRLVPATLVVSAALLVAEWGLLASNPAAASVFVYLHYAGLGALLISGFWSMVSEHFDPRSAKRYVGKIAAGGTVGGLIGGIMAERIGYLFSVPAMLPALAGLHLLAAVVLGVSPLRRRHEAETRTAETKPKDAVSGFKTIGRTPYLRNLVLLVFLVTISEMLIDYVFKAQADARFSGGTGLLRFFAIFYTGVSLLTVALQAIGARRALQKLGLAQTVGLMPAVTAVGGGIALAFPGLATAGMARGGEITLRNSLYRAGYELLFSPIAPRDKRATKTLVDVGVVRVGDMVGGVLVKGILVLGALALNTMLALAVMFSFLAIYVARRLHVGYVKTLEKSLLSQARSLDGIDDAATRTAILQTIGQIDLREIFEQDHDIVGSPSVAVPAQRASRPSLEGGGPLADSVARILDLTTTDVAVVRSALMDDPLEPEHIPYAIRLLAWNDVAVDAIRALRPVAATNVGQFVDHMIDPDEEFAIRRRLPLVLAMCPHERAASGLLRGLNDARFEVRYRCGRALNYIRNMDPSVPIPPPRVITAILREVAVDDGVWRSRQLLDQMDDETWSPVMDELLIDRSDRSLEHVFTLLSLIMPSEPLKIAFKGLHTDDKMLRGTALEYLETALPAEIKMALWPFLADHRGRKSSARTPRDVVHELLQSNQSIVVNLEALRNRAAEGKRAAEGDGGNGETES